MLLVKMGKEHKDGGINCQDFAIESKGFKMIVDGCSSCANSEVGAKLFCNLYPKSGYDVRRTFNVLRALYDSDEDLKNNLLFTINMVTEYEDHFEVATCGDGYIIKQRHDGSLEYESYDYDNMPPYYAYNLLYNKSSLSKYKDGVDFVRNIYLKSEYKNIGVSSDGLQYILNSSHKDEFEQILKSGKLLKLKLFINRNINEFKDDMSIVF